MWHPSPFNAKIEAHLYWEGNRQQRVEGTDGHARVVTPLIVPWGDSGGNAAQKDRIWSRSMKAIRVQGQGTVHDNCARNLWVWERCGPAFPRSPSGTFWKFCGSLLASVRYLGRSASLCLFARYSECILWRTLNKPTPREGCSFMSTGRVDRNDEFLTLTSATE